eukprot:6886266-Prymnesium_polylepis.2
MQCEHEPRAHSCHAHITAIAAAWACGSFCGRSQLHLHCAERREGDVGCECGVVQRCDRLGSPTELHGFVGSEHAEHLHGRLGQGRDCEADPVAAVPDARVTNLVHYPAEAKERSEQEGGEREHGAAQRDEQGHGD